MHGCSAAKSIPLVVAREVNGMRTFFFNGTFWTCHPLGRMSAWPHPPAISSALRMARASAPVGVLFIGGPKEHTPTIGGFLVGRLQ